MDLQAFLRTRIDNTLITASWVERVKLILGLEGVSQVWCEPPAWYFWLADAPGPYELRLENVDEDDDSADGIVTGLFAVRLFPRPSGYAFSSFSPQERNLVVSNLFDETNTLRLEAREQVHPHLFTIATIGMSLSVENESFGLLTLEAPEVSVWRIRSPHGAEANHRESDQETSNGVLRNVPAWRLARGLFDCLVSLHAFAANTRPERVIVTSSPGFEVVQDQDGTITLGETTDGRILTQSVLFTPTGAEAHSMAKVLERDGAAHDSQVLLDWKADCECRHFPLSEASVHVCKHWWSIAAVERISHHGSTCGCH